MFQCIHLLTEAGDKLLAELGDFIVISCSAPAPVPLLIGATIRGNKPYDEEALYWRRMQRRFDVQNRDDLDVVRVLTEFLSRQ